nr:hypothetical protein [Tanacetum cinerariifolium]
MFGYKVTSHVRHSRLMDVFDKFAAKEGESLEFVYERLKTLVNIIDRNNVHLILVSINTKFLNCLQLEWSKYVTMCYNRNEKGHYARDCQKPRVRDAKYFTEQMLLAMKDKAGSNLNNKENDFILDTSYGEETMGELIAIVMLMARIQPADGNVENVPSYDAKAVSEVNASSKVHDQMSHVKRKTFIHTSDDDQINSNIIFDDSFVKNNGARLGYKNPERLNKAIAAHSKKYNGDMLHSVNLKINSPDSEETLEDAKES